MLDGVTVRRVADLLDRFGLPTRLDPPIEPDLIVETMRRDKKASGGVARFVLLERIGRAVIRENVPESRVREAYESLLE